MGESFNLLTFVFHTQHLVCTESKDTTKYKFVPFFGESFHLKFVVFFGESFHLRKLHCFCGESFLLSSKVPLQNYSFFGETFHLLTFVFYTPHLVSLERKHLAKNKLVLFFGESFHLSFFHFFWGKPPPLKITPFLRGKLPPLQQSFS